VLQRSIIWMLLTGVCLDVLRHLPHVPVLGVCLGHQALAAAHGAQVVGFKHMHLEKEERWPVTDL